MYSKSDTCYIYKKIWLQSCILGKIWHFDRMRKVFYSISADNLRDANREYTSKSVAFFYSFINFDMQWYENLKKNKTHISNFTRYLKEKFNNGSDNISLLRILNVCIILDNTAAFECYDMNRQIWCNFFPSECRFQHE